MLSGLLYFSLASPNLDDLQLANIISSARKSNAERGISGQLHYENGLFLQWIEGETTQIEGLWKKIFIDNRHSRLTKMFSGEISIRSFGNWDMQFSDQKDGFLLDYIQSREISLENRTTGDASRLIAFLKDTVSTDRYRPITDIKALAPTASSDVYFRTRRNNHSVAAE